MWPFSRKLDRSALQLAELELRITELESKHMRLRGAVYGMELHRRPLKDSAEAQEATIPRTKDELRKLAGIKAGVPYPHTTEKESGK